MPHEASSTPAISVFSSYGTSLRTWDDAGMLSREAEYLRLLQSHLGPVSMLSYGGGIGEEVLAEEASLETVKMRPRWTSKPVYSVFAGLIHWRSLRASRAFRTNQLRGAWTAAIASMIHRKPLAVRSGYIWSQFNENAGGSGLRLKIVKSLEKFALNRADVVIVASEADRDLLITRHGVPGEKAHVVPNPIDTRMFCPDPSVKPLPGLITFIGRLEPQKGIGTLIDSMNQVPNGKLRIIGDGSQRQALEERAEGLDVEFMGTVRNEKLPALLREAQLFALPSLYEGTPKALLEAMACGLPVIASRSGGNEGVIVGGINGLLVERTPSEFSGGINKLMRDSELREKFSIAGRRYVSERHSMEAAAKHEARIIREMAERRGVTLNEQLAAGGAVEEQSQGTA